MGGAILGALLEYLSKKFKRKRLNYRCWQKNIQLLFFNRSTLVIHVEYTGAVKPLFREIGNRQSGRWKPIVRNRVPPFISYLQSVYSLNAGLTHKPPAWIGS